MPHSNACSESFVSVSPSLTQPAVSSDESIDSSRQSFRYDVLEGLSQSKRRLHCKYFYDRRGSQLFDRICELPEYYPTRTEAGIMLANADAIARRIGSHAVLLEYGSGSSTKTRLLLDHLDRQRAYLPVDISREHLLHTAATLRIDYPHLDIHPIVADFTAPFSLPMAYRKTNNTVYFPGSTIGNLESSAAIALLENIATQCKPNGGLLIGFDLRKDLDVLLAAYDDSQGVTAQFNLNLLHRINRELDANFDVNQFKHVAIYNDEMSRIEIYIESCTHQRVEIESKSFVFAPGDRILTEYSHKYDVDAFAAMAEQAGLFADEVWTDAKDYFAVMHLSAR